MTKLQQHSRPAEFNAREVCPEPPELLRNVPGNVAKPVTLWRADKDDNATQSASQWQIAEEVAAAIIVDGKSLAVMMVTPANFEEMTIGFLLSEGYFLHPDDFRFQSATKTASGYRLTVLSTNGSLIKSPERAMEGRSGCGLCGVQSLSDVDHNTQFARRRRLSPADVQLAFARLPEVQPMRALNHSVHGAGFWNHSGELQWVREDVGRHNALDKLIGALIIKGINPADGFAVMSSRCSFELVKKAAIVNFGGLATISAPTTLALSIAEKAGLPLACKAAGGVALF